MSYDVVIGVCTRNRVDSLGLLLESLSQLDYAGLESAVVVVDNDAQATAYTTVSGYDHPRVPIHYVHEPKGGVSSARNRLASEASKLAPKYVAFVDDDQTVDQDWLRKLHEVAERYGGAGAAGAILPVFNSRSPSWARNGFFDRSRPRTGTPVGDIPICNVLVRQDLVDELQAPFGLHFQSPGGEDTLFLHRIRTRGGPIVACNEAIVREVIPDERAKVSWLLHRAFLFGSRYTEYRRLLRGGIPDLGLVALKSGVRVVRGVLTLPVGVLRGRRETVLALQLIASGAGGFVGFTTRVEKIDE